MAAPPRTDALRGMLRAPSLAPLLGDAALLSAMLRFEAALALAQADHGLVPRPAAETIERVCMALAADPSPLDPAGLAQQARRASTLAIPFVKRLTDVVAAVDTEAGRYVHLGATSQDVIDSATSLVLRDAGRAVDPLLRHLAGALAALADRHRRTPMTGRTLLQAAVPISFGWKAAGWLAQTMRTRRALAELIDAHALLQFGGASGTLAALGTDAAALTALLAQRLGLPPAPISWHGARDGFARIGAELAVLCGGMARIGRDVSLLMQPEVAEAFEPAGAGRGASSAMPHKRNPVGSMLALEAAYRAPGLAATLLGELASEHERGLGTWQHSAFVLFDLFDAAGSAVDAIVEVMDGLRLDTAAMRANLDARQGFVYAEALAMRLAETLGKAAAQQRVEALCRQALDRGISLPQALADDAELMSRPDAAQLADVFEPSAQLAGADAMIDAVLAQWRTGEPGRAGEPEQPGG
ncbi:MAG: lyase family protein [Burkholderiaceae bacterium]